MKCKICDLETPDECKFYKGVLKYMSIDRQYTQGNKKNKVILWTPNYL